MSVSSLSSSLPSADNALLASLGVNSGASDAITIDLKTYQQAKSAGDTSTADAAIVQLKSDLASEQQQLLAGLEGSSETATDNSGNSLLSSFMTLNSNSDLSSALASMQALAAQNGQGSSGTGTQATATEEADTLQVTGAQVNVSA